MNDKKPNAEDIQLIKRVDPKIVHRYFETFQRESDRGAVLITVAVLDEILTHHLKLLLGEGDASSRDRLLGVLGALSSFSSKVDLAFCVGLLPEMLYEDIRRLNKLRNECAHDWETFHFTEDVMSRFIEPMHMMAVAIGMEQRSEEKSKFKFGQMNVVTGKTPKGKFGMLMALLLDLVKIYLQVETENRVKQRKEK